MTRAELLRDPLDEAEVDRSVAPGRRADGHEDDVGVGAPPPRDRMTREVGPTRRPMRPARRARARRSGSTPRSSGSSLCGSTSTPTTVCPSFDEARGCDGTYVSQTDDDDVHPRSVSPVAKAATTRFGKRKYLRLPSALEVRSPDASPMGCRLRSCSSMPLRASSRRLRSAEGSAPAVRVDVAVAVCQGRRERDRHRTLRGCSSAPPHDRVRRCRVDAGAWSCCPSFGSPHRGSPIRSPEIWSNQATLVLTQEGAPELRSVLPSAAAGGAVVPRGHESVRRADRRLHDSRDERRGHPSARSAAA